MRCLVTGATGFIGRSLCWSLQAQGQDVVALSRSGRPIAGVSEHIVVDFVSETLPGGVMKGVDVVYHLAGIAHQRASESLYQRVNVDATLALAKAAEAQGVGLFVFVSSVRAMGVPSPGLPRTEQQVTKPADAYGLSKWQAEEALRKRFANSAMAVVILRPALVCAPDAGGNLAVLRQAVQRGLPRPPAVGARSVIARKDVLDVLRRVGDDSWQGVSTYIVCDRRACSFQEMYDIFSSAYGVKKGRTLPMWMWRSLCFAVQRWQNRPLGDALYDKLFAYDRYDSSALCERLHWHPSTPLVEALTGTAGQAC